MKGMFCVVVEYLSNSAELVSEISGSCDLLGEIFGRITSSGNQQGIVIFGLVIVWWEIRLIKADDNPPKNKQKKKHIPSLCEVIKENGLWEILMNGYIHPTFKDVICQCLHLLVEKVDIQISCWWFRQGGACKLKSLPFMLISFQKLFRLNSAISESVVGCYQHLELVHSTNCKV